jgi:hypothetical protein
MSKLRVDNIVDRNGNSTPEFINGLTSNGDITINGSLSVSGISTFGPIICSNVNITGVITATNFSGDGSALTNLPVISAGNAIGLKYILDPLPYRS